VAQGQLSGISSNQVPRQPQRGEKKDAEENLQCVIRKCQEWNEQRGKQEDSGDERLPFSHARWLPKIPLGFRESTRMKRTKSTARAHSLPQ
jgi:hypothetical protein